MWNISQSSVYIQACINEEAFKKPGIKQVCCVFFSCVRLHFINVTQENDEYTTDDNSLGF